MLLDTHHIPIDTLRSALLDKKKIVLKVARLDQLHDIVSGNKIFKLKYFLAEAIKQQRPIVTFGGPYSNHLAATAFACRQAGIPCYGIVRGEEPNLLSTTLKNCRAHGMELIFLPRSIYRHLADGSNQLPPGIPTGALIVPEGGYDPAGASGASKILDSLADQQQDAIVVAVGTATTLAGLLQNSKDTVAVVAVPVLKNFNDLPHRLHYLNGQSNYKNLRIWDHYHFGGYAKKNQELIKFMNQLYLDHSLPTDFVYTAKMMFAVMDKIGNDYFPPGTRILCMHTGGLQGNQSLSGGTLGF